VKTKATKVLIQAGALFSIVLGGAFLLFGIYAWSTIVLPEDTVSITGTMQGYYRPPVGRTSFFGKSISIECSEFKANIKLESSFVSDLDNLKGHRVSFDIAKNDSSHLQSSQTLTAYNLRLESQALSPNTTLHVYRNVGAGGSALIGASFLLIGFAMIISLRRARSHVGAT
jgi:hypothetical protein